MDRYQTGKSRPEGKMSSRQHYSRLRVFIDEENIHAFRGTMNAIASMDEAATL